MKYNLTVSTALAAVLMAPTAAMADFAFTDPGVGHYRVYFGTTAVTDALSADINYYNAFVTTAAATSPTLPTTTWRAVVSTPTVNAQDNVSCGAYCDANVPVYDVNGNLVASSTAAFFAANMIANVDVTEHGVDYGWNYIWSGSQPNTGIGAFGYEMGASSDESYLTNWGPYYTYTTFAVFALSDDIGAPVPEPATAALLGFGALAAAAVRRKRRAAD